MRINILILLFALVRPCLGAGPEIVFDPSPPTGWPSLGTNANFGVSHGSISNVLAESVKVIRIRCFSTSWTNAEQVKLYIKGILADGKSTTYEAPVWNQMFVPEIECVIEYKNSKHGTWLIGWGLSCFQDSTGKYWFSGHDIRLRSEASHNQGAAARMQAETERAFELERSADLVIDYERPDGIRLWTPPQSTYISANDETLAAAISSTTTKRRLAVVIIGKPVRYAFPEPQLRSKVDAIESVVRAQGFARIVFQLASARGRPIYRE